MKIKNYILIILVCLFTAGCKTTGYFSGYANLVIMIVDEKGLAIEDFNLELSNFNKEEKGITNKNGICVFHNVPSGEYELSGIKDGYAKLEAASINFIEKSDVFCFRVESGEAIFQQVEKNFEAEKYESGIKLLEKIVCPKKSELYAAVCFYKAFAFAMLNDTKACKREIKKIKAADKAFAEQYQQALVQLSELRGSMGEDDENKDL